MRASDVMHVLDAAYRVEQEPRAWLTGVMAAMEPHLDSGLGVTAYFVDVSRPGTFTTAHYTGTGMLGGPTGEARFEKWSREVPIEVKRFTHLFGPCGYGSDIPQLRDGGSVREITHRAHGIPDMLGINALDATGRGCALAAASNAPRRRLGKGRYHLFSQLAAHIAAGARLARTVRASRADLSAGAEAIVDPAGKVAHATGAARDKSARDALTDAAVRIDRARGRHARLAAADMTQVWQGLVAERWSLVDHFDRDGRRYFIARANAPEVPGQPALSPREAQVVGAAAMGHGTKVIAYELGISASSVATHLRRAAAKLGVTSRVQLIRAFLAGQR